MTQGGRTTTPDESKRLTEPLLDSSDGNDVERPLRQFGRYSSADEPDEHASLPPSTKRIRAYIAWEKRFWETRTFLSCMAYLFLAALIVAAEEAQRTQPLIVMTEESAAALIWAYYGILWFWALIQLTCTVYLFLSGAFFYKFSGRAVVFEIIFLVLVFLPEWMNSILPPPGEVLWQQYIILISMALVIYVQKCFTAPVVYKLHLYFNGVATEGELKQSKKGQGPPLVKGISNDTLQTVAVEAARAIDIHDERSHQRIREALAGLTIRRTNEADALDDWALVIQRLSKATAIPLFTMCNNGRIPSSSYRKLVGQLLLFLRVYCETGKLVQEGSPKRTLPLSFAEALMVVFSLSWNVKGMFFLTVVPACILATLPPLIAHLIGAFIRSVTRWNPDGTPNFDEKGALTSLLALMAMGYLLMPVLQFTKNFFQARYVSQLGSWCRKRMLNVMMKGGTEYSEVYRGGKLCDAFSNQLTQVEMFTQIAFMNMLQYSVTVIASVITAAIDLPIASVLFISMVPIIFSIDYFSIRGIRASVKQASVDGRFAGMISSTVECKPVIRACNAGSWTQTQFSDMMDETQMAHKTAFFRSTLIGDVFQLYFALYALAITVPLGLRVIAGYVPIADFTTLIGLLAPLTGALLFLGQLNSQVSLYSGAIQTVRDLTKSDFDEEPSSSSANKTTLAPFAKSLVMSDIKFRYREDLPNVLTDVNIEFPKGSYTCLCGGSGSGKSTVLNILMRFRTPNEGSVEWDGQDIFKTSLASFRDNVTVMFQKTMILQATVRDNILFGFDETPGAVEAAARNAEIHDAILLLPHGYDTLIGGDSLTNMSGGQLQRLCLARALYRDPSVLLLDEATSALDKLSEDAIIDTLVKLRDEKGLTLISVTHRPSTCIKANQIIVLERGSISECGTYDELVSTGGLFSRLVAAGEEK
mmetsp:Transcript_2378/g.5240  ORF Transcript_2378/g.5240 Transcript_2378/m.5240 type:complete len:928 (-) Transcript_2378:1043-3826(-)